MIPIHHSLVLNLHQPAWNLEALLEEREWEAKEILFAIDRIPRALWDYADVGRVHLAMSGTLLETLASPGFQARTYGIVDCGSLLWHLQNEQIIRILGTAYYHAVLPLIPESDREPQLARWLGIARHLFARHLFGGFWPPELGFAMELIPLLKRLGYWYVIVDSKHVEPITEMSWEELRYRPHFARYGGEEIVVVVRDRDLSDAQESGMEYSWFKRELEARTRHCSVPPMVTTCTDGDNGGWFRNTTHGANFWSAFYHELAEDARHGGRIRPAFIDEYIRDHGVHGEVRVTTGAWNTGWHDGVDFVQWTGSQAQKDALWRVGETSAAVRDATLQAMERGGDHDLFHQIEQATWHLLRAETSCNFYWGEAWVHRCHGDLDVSWEYVHRARALLMP